MWPSQIRLGSPVSRKRLAVNENGASQLQPSVFGETLKARGAHGFHHWAVGARDFDKSVAHYRSLGYAEAFSDTAPMGFRVVYFDTTRDLPGMLEVIEMNAAAEQGFHTMYQAAQEWDGKTHMVHKIETA